MVVPDVMAQGHGARDSLATVRAHVLVRVVRVGVIDSAVIHIEALVLLGRVEPFHVLPEGRLIWGRFNAVGALVLDIEFKVPVLNVADQAPVVSVVSKS